MKTLVQFIKEERKELNSDFQKILDKFIDTWNNTAKKLDDNYADEHGKLYFPLILGNNNIPENLCEICGSRMLDKNKIADLFKEDGVFSHVGAVGDNPVDTYITNLNDKYDCNRFTFAIRNEDKYEHEVGIGLSTELSQQNTVSFCIVEFYPRKVNAWKEDKEVPVIYSNYQFTLKEKVSKAFKDKYKGFAGKYCKDIQIPEIVKRIKKGIKSKI